jgi:hypothetical protein
MTRTTAPSISYDNWLVVTTISNAWSHGTCVSLRSTLPSIGTVGSMTRLIPPVSASRRSTVRRSVA